MTSPRRRPLADVRQLAPHELRDLPHPEASLQLWLPHFHHVDATGTTTVQELTARMTPRHGLALYDRLDRIHDPEALRDFRISMRQLAYVHEHFDTITLTAVRDGLGRL